MSDLILAASTAADDTVAAPMSRIWTADRDSFQRELKNTDETTLA